MGNMVLYDQSAGGISAADREAVPDTDRFVLYFAGRSRDHKFHWCVRDRVAGQLVVCVGTEDCWHSFVAEEQVPGGFTKRYIARGSVPAGSDGSRQLAYYTVPVTGMPVSYGTDPTCSWQLLPLTSAEQRMVDLAVRNMNDLGIPVRTPQQRQELGGH